MRTTRMSLAGLMIVVAVIALNVAAVRAALSSENRSILLLPYQCAPMALATQAGLYFAALARHRRRLFWLGFTASGIAAALSLVTWFPGTANLWRSYFLWVEGLYVRSPEVSRFVAGHRGLHSVVSLLIYSVPQFVVAVAGGFLGVGLGGRLSGDSARAVPPRDMR